ncbi:hypothetical protein P154DRAFT_151876 [Amniculicola lignicola CBS 123094]|uniref:Myb-like domain-containing protein n=1 Tax=Amniculicola lignicola CBS 123094 TaxID=1392246 RepID=A0A6A5WMC6_9PLEO|nr:hypothetical protein P154DRAFT_151876 [Amniculicola lignicola CBS 123094]
MSHQPPSSPYNVGGYGQQPHPSSSSSRKRSRPEDHLGLDLPNPLEQAHNPYDQPSSHLPVGHQTAQQGYPLPAYQQPVPPQAAPRPSHHHHHLPNQPDNNKRQRVDMAESSTSPQQQHHIGPPSMVGQEGMPQPAQRPRGPKLKFTPEDDTLLIDLKEKKNLTWKQIADFFPGRSSGTLQVRYCTKLKAKTTNWTDEMVQKLRGAMHDYETDRWRIIAQKVGNGFSPQACRDKAFEMQHEQVEPEEEDPEQTEYTQSQLGPGPSDPAAAFQ